MNDLLHINLDIGIRTYALMSLVICATIYMIYQNLNDFVLDDHVLVIWQQLRPNISCHYSREGDALPSAEDAGFAPAPRSIFFHETSCRGGLNSRQACAVESAARAHPRRQVHLLFSAPVTEYALKNSCIAKLLEFQNVKVARVHIDQYCQNTPISSTLLKNLKYSSDLIEKTAEILRIVTLNKYGGIYLGLDMLVVKSLEPLGWNWIVKLSDEDLAEKAIAFDNDEVRRGLTEIMIYEISSNYDPRDTVFRDPDVVHLVLNEICPKLFNSTATQCQGITVYPQEMFFPVPGDYWYVYYDARDLDNLETPYTHCVWGRLAENSTIDKLSPFAKLAKKYCPIIYEMYGDEFGE